MPPKAFTTVKIWPETLKNLRYLAALRSKRNVDVQTMVKVMDDLVKEALEAETGKEPPHGPPPLSWYKGDPNA